MKKSRLEEQKKIKDDLDLILDDMEDEGRTADVKAFSALKENRVAKICALNYSQIKKNAEIKANSQVNSIVRFYLNSYDTEDAFLRNKMQSDKFRLAKQQVQLDIVEHSLAKLNEEIDTGNYNPRLWEVMATLMKSFDSMNITYAKLEILIENNYKVVQEELDYKKQLKIANSSSPEIVKLSPGGRKALLKNISQSLKNDEANKFLNPEYEIK